MSGCRFCNYNIPVAINLETASPEELYSTNHSWSERLIEVEMESDVIGNCRTIEYNGARACNIVNTRIII